MSALRRQDTPTEETPVATLPTTSPEVLAQIRECYAFLSATDEAQALAILSRRPDVAGVLLEAPPHVSAIFGEGASIWLIVVSDPSSDSLRLSARIDTPAPLHEALAQRGAFYRAWWRSVPDDIDTILSFGL